MEGSRHAYFLFNLNNAKINASNKIKNGGKEWKALIEKH